MKQILFPFLSILLICCHFPKAKSHDPKSNKPDSTQNQKTTRIQYSDSQLKYFLDSIGQLPSQTWMDKVSFYSDSIFKNQQAVNDSLSADDFIKLKMAIKSKTIDFAFAKKILPNLVIDSFYLKKDKIPLTFISFDHHKFEFNEFAVCAGDTDIDWFCDLYFFKSNRIISKHRIEHRYGLNLKHYKDSDGKTIVFYKENYESGSGIWWFNYYFYKYSDNKIIPVLNEIQDANLQYPWHIRVLRLESRILKTNPLTIKMVYSQELPDTANNLHPIINDSTVIQYKWNDQSKTLVGDYSKLSKAQMITWYLQDNELLFINSFHSRLRNMLNDSLVIRNATLEYLNNVKNVTQSISH